MTDDSGAGPVGTASAGVEGLADSVTSALGKAGPIGELAQPVVSALRDVWEGYFGAPIPPGQTNWNAYTHQQLYDMLWHNADVGDVSSMASEWGRHSSELGNQATALRGQQTAMRSHWSGAAAEPAANRLGELGDRSEGIGTRAGTVQQATQHAGDALSVARNTMPPPPGDPTALVLSSAVAGAGAGAAIGGVVGAGAGGVGAGPGALMGAAIGAVAAGGASLLLASVNSAQKKAEAVHVMERYEAGLADAGGSIAGTPAGATEADSFGSAGLATTTSGFVGGSGTGAGGLGSGMPWKQLVGNGPFGAGGFSAGARSAAAEESELARMGMLQAEEAVAAETAATGMMPPGVRTGAGAQDREHRNRLPTLDRQLFVLESGAAVPVIGEQR